MLPRTLIDRQGRMLQVLFALRGIIRTVIDRQGLRVQSQHRLKTQLPRGPPQAECPVAAQTQAEGNRLQRPTGARTR